MDKYCEESILNERRNRMKLIIDVEKDYYEMLKYNVEHGQEYKPFEIIANGIPYDDKERGKGMNAKKCDRCGALYVPYDYKNIGEAWRYSVVKCLHPYPDTTLDLCNNCLLDLEKWVKKGGAE